MKKIFTFIVVLAMIFLASCTSNYDSTTYNYNGQELTEEESEIEKLNLYVWCINSFSNYTDWNNIDNYLDWISDTETGPTWKEKYIRWITKVYTSPEDCISDISIAKSMPPKNEALELAWDQYAIDIKAYYDILEEANTYYENEDYKDDNMAKWKEMHPKIIKAYEDFADAFDLLGAETDKVNNKITERQLAELEWDESRKLEYYHYKAFSLSKKVLDLWNVEDIFTEVDPVIFEKVVDEYGDIIDEYDEYLKNNDLDEIWKNYSLIFSATKIYIEMSLDSHKDFYSEAKKMMRRVRDADAYTEDELKDLWRNITTNVPGNPWDLVTKYNNLINDYNRVNF